MFEVLDHTADVGILVRADTLDEFFAEAARGMFSILHERTAEGEAVVHEIRLDAQDMETLLVNWLSELLFLFESRNFVPREFRFSALEPELLEATCVGTAVELPAPGTEIKAVTHHMLRVEYTSDGWEARIYFDL
ncbi:MAG: archease [bacterium]